MLNFYIVGSISAAIAIVILSTFVLLRNTKAYLNQLFFVFSIDGGIWIVFNYFAGSASVSSGVSLLLNRLTFLFAGVGLMSLLLFTKELVKSKLTNKFKVLLTIDSLLILLTLTPLVVQSVYKYQGTYGIKFGTLSYLYFLSLILNILITLWVLFRAKFSKDSVAKPQISLILNIFGLFLLVVISTNAIVPLLFNYYGLTNAGSFSIYILIIGMGYAITRHKLFDIRMAVARSIGYVLSLVIIVLAFVIGSFALTNLLFKKHQLSNGYDEAIYISISVIMIFIFQRIKNFFDKITNKLFFRDIYDTQEFLDNFNKTLVSTFELTPLLRKTSELIEATLKPSYCLFGIKEDANNSQRILGTKNHPLFDPEEIDYVRSLTPHMHSKLIVTDLLESKYLDLQKLLQQRNVSIIARLASSLNNEGIGYLVLGPRKSGNMYSPQDIKVLEIIANELVIAIQNALHNEEIENFNLSLQEKIESATRRLSATNDKLRSLDEAKDDFVSMASHQLRTPLTSVKGNISLVLEGDAGRINPTQRQLLNQAFASSQRMVYLIADLLNVSRLNTGKFIIEQTAVDLASVVEEEVNQLIETAKSRHLTLDYQKPHNISLLKLDETKTRQVIMNFVDNAIYYTPAGGRIDVVINETETSVECLVIDNGIGVPSSEQHHLFSKFYRAKNARKARPDGTGLGLFMAKKVIIAEGGAIIFKSREGQGSTFGFSFPKASLKVKNSPTTDLLDKQMASVI